MRSSACSSVGPCWAEGELANRTTATNKANRQIIEITNRGCGALFLQPQPRLIVVVLGSGGQQRGKRRTGVVTWTNTVIASNSGTCFMAVARCARWYRSG